MTLIHTNCEYHNQEKSKQPHNPHTIAELTPFFYLNQQKHWFFIKNTGQDHTGGNSLKSLKTR